MALNSSGPISLGGATSGQSVNLEIGAGASSLISFNDANVRTLTGTSSLSTLIMPTDFWGKSLGTTVSYLAIAGGGGGQTLTADTAGGGGGGAGGVVSGSVSIPSGTAITVTIGSGGSASAVGTNSSFSGSGITTVSAVGGGLGPSGAGGSGGGAYGGTTASGGTRTVGQGSVGGSTTAGGAGAGGGGYGTAGGDGDGFVGGSGGSGVTSTISGSSSTYAGGGGGGGGQSQYLMARSLRFRANNTAYLNRSPASAGNRKTWTWSAWVKRGLLSNDYQYLLSAFYYSQSGPYNNYQHNICFTDTDNLRVLFFAQDDGPTTYTYNLTTTQVFRDPGAWYHIVVAWDTTQATASDRVKIYVNGTQVTAFSTSTYPTQNLDGYVNSTYYHSHGAFLAPPNYPTAYYKFDGYLAEVNFVNGLALTPSSFGTTNSTTGVWQAIPYSGAYGTNGYELQFSDNSSLTTSSNTGLGKDFSGNGNYWTTNNISLTAGVTYDSMTDVPTPSSATVSNYPTLNSLAPNPAGTPIYRDGNMYINCASASNFTVSPATMLLPTTGKWYAEFYAVYGDSSTSLLDMGLIGSTDFPLPSNVIGTTATSYNYRSNGNKINNNSSAAYGATYTTGDLIAIAFDATAGTLTFYKNNTSQGVAFTGLAAQYFFAVGGYNFAQWQVNFGQRPFVYTPPTGFTALNAYNLSNPLIPAGNKYMDATLWTGNGGSSQTIVNSGAFKPDFVWFKARNQTYGHLLFDSVRGVSKYLQSNSTGAEVTDSTMLTSLNSNGYTVGSSGFTNQSGTTFVGWQWQAGQGTTSTNTSGTITSTVSVNTTAGFSVVTYSGNSTNSTVGHGLGVAPSMIFIKGRTNTSDWRVYHASVALPNVLNLNTTSAAGSDPAAFTSTSPTSSVFSIGSGAGVNSSGNTYVAYCWTPIAGFSAFGSLTGNGSANGPFVYLGFRPKFILRKGVNTAGINWSIIDTSRNTNNVANSNLFPNLADAEGSSGDVDITSNGFKVRSTSFNISGETYIYAAFAETPFKYALAR